MLALSLGEDMRRREFISLLGGAVGSTDQTLNVRTGSLPTPKTAQCRTMTAFPPSRIVFMELAPYAAAGLCCCVRPNRMNWMCFGAVSNAS
jgi:hypothetical protein